MLETLGITGNELSSLYQLPGWLSDARDGEKVCAELRRVVPEFERDEWVLKRCDTGRFHFKHDYWTGTYKVTVARPGQPDAKTIAFLGKVYAPGMLSDKKAGSGGAFGAEGWRAVIPSLNLELQAVKEESLEEALTVLTDPEELRRFLESKIREREAYRNIQIAVCTPNVVRYKPGSRCTIVYRLGYSPDARRSKPRRKSWLPRRTTARKAAMLLKDGRPLGVAARFQQYGLHCRAARLRAGKAHPHSRANSGRKTLKDLMKLLSTGAPDTMAELEDAFCKTAVGLAELHRSGVRSGKEFRWEDQMAEARERLERLSSPYRTGRGCYAAVGPVG